MIYIIITASINTKVGIQNETHRKKTYMDSIQHLLTLVQSDPSIKPIVVENNGVRQTYLDKLNCDVVYTENNKLNFPNKGGNELLDIKHVITQYNIQDDDIVVKLTGRYKLLTLSFIELIKNNSHCYDAFVKFFNVCTLKYMFDDCVLGLFAIRCKYLKDFNYEFKKSPECEFSNYIRNNIEQSKLMEIEKLDLECCFADNLRILRV